MKENKVGGKGDKYKISIERWKSKRPLGKCWRKLEDIVKHHVKETWFKIVGKS
jgi:hypothetical protein